MEKHEPIPCPFCGGKATYRDTRLIYGRSYGMAYICERYPKCDSYVGAHKDTGDPKGTIADRKLRKLRVDAHSAFDALWTAHEGRRVFASRGAAYKNLREFMRLTRDECHIGMFDAKECHRVLDFARLVKERVRGNAK